MTKPLPESAVFKAPTMADVIENIAIEGPRLFYEGEIAEAIAEACISRGGHVSRDDLAEYRTVRRQPLASSFNGVKLITNPPPSAGGALISFALSLLDGGKLDAADFLGTDHAAAIARAILLTDRARFDRAVTRGTAGHQFDPNLLHRYKTEVLGLTPASRGTTHLSVVDRQGTAVSLTVSNGEGCGWIHPDLGFMLNNMLGEEDLLPNGIGSWRPDTRLSSMMAPTIAETSSGLLTALGSGGSSRIRSAVLQVLVNRFDFGRPLDEAVEAPRMHLEGERADIEPGFAEDAAGAVDKLDLEAVSWTYQDMFFGGVHAVERSRTGAVFAAADPRREGAALIL